MSAGEEGEEGEKYTLDAVHNVRVAAVLHNVHLYPTCISHHLLTPTLRVVYNMRD